MPEKKLFLFIGRFQLPSADSLFYKLPKGPVRVLAGVPGGAFFGNKTAVLGKQGIYIYKVSSFKECQLSGDRPRLYDPAV